MFVEDLEKLENVINVLFNKKEVPSVRSEGERSRINIEIENFAAICKDYKFNDNKGLFEVKPFDEYTYEDLYLALFRTRDLAKKLFERKDLTLTDQGEVGLFIDFINDSFALNKTPF